jgi:predicted nuclease with RNAse H fold
MLHTDEVAIDMPVAVPQKGKIRYVLFQTIKFKLSVHFSCFEKLAMRSRAAGLEQTKNLTSSRNALNRQELYAFGPGD